MKKVLVVADTYYPKIDGVVIFLREILPRLSSFFEITLLVPDFKHEVPLKNVRIVKLETSRFVRFANYESVRNSFKNRRKIRDLVQAHDIIWVQDLAFLGGLSLYYGRRYKKKTVAFVHQLIWEQMGDLTTQKPLIRKAFVQIAKKTAAWLYTKADVLLLPSEETEHALKGMRITGKKKIIPLGIDTKTFSPTMNKSKAKIELGIDPQKIVIGYVGRLTKEKNVETLKDAFEQLKHKYPVTLLIVGGGNDTLTKELQEQGAKVTGFVPFVVPYLHAMDIFVMPSLTETTSLATMEALSCGIPVIATPVGRMKEYIEKGVNGYFFPKEDVTALAQRLEDLLQHQEKRAALAKNARKTMEGHDWQRTAEKIQKVFEEK